VRPGLTGLAQVRGRNALSWDERFALDVWYVDNRSVALNLRICAETVMTVLRRDGISADGDVTMPEFYATRPNPVAADYASSVGTNRRASERGSPL
jgi:hypothetical protein